MDPPRHSPPFSAPGGSFAGEMQAAPAAGGAVARTVLHDLPPVDEHIATPETREQYFDGKLRQKMSAKPPHATQHHRLHYVLEAHVAEGYLGAVDMLTRTGHKTDFGPDASVFPVPDPATGKRKIEELAFEVCSEQSLSVPADKARKLLNRGVRRVFCIVVGGPGHGRRPNLSGNYVAEWSTATNGWSPLPIDSTIQDKCLHAPLPVRALLDATVSDDAVVAALRARGNRAIQEILAEGEARGEVKEARKAALFVVEHRWGAAPDDFVAKLQAIDDLERLHRIMEEALKVRSLDEIDLDS